MNDGHQRLTSLKPLYMWHEQHLRRGGRLFPTMCSLKWFIRQHRELLITLEVMVPGKGGRHTLVTPDFGNVVYDILFSDKGKH